jgi:hypothetical protein
VPGSVREWRSVAHLFAQAEPSKLSSVREEQVVELGELSPLAAVMARPSTWLVNRGVWLFQLNPAAEPTVAQDAKVRATALELLLADQAEGPNLSMSGERSDQDIDRTCELRLGVRIDPCSLSRECSISEPVREPLKLRACIKLRRHDVSIVGAAADRCSLTWAVGSMSGPPPGCCSPRGPMSAGSSSRLVVARVHAVYVSLAETGLLPRR